MPTRRLRDGRAHRLGARQRCEHESIAFPGVVVSRNVRHGRAGASASVACRGDGASAAAALMDHELLARAVDESQEFKQKLVDHGVVYIETLG
mmetsp:Transcript_151897/g.487486  ORF Transcript_151897/g.487486 Transcript_151897/m.487486 type:complete len:93 (+) Transcript_151897:192-470(+)